jgi:hypothetical protein
MDIPTGAGNFFPNRDIWKMCAYVCEGRVVWRWIEGGFDGNAVVKRNEVRMSSSAEPHKRARPKGGSLT